MNDEFIFEAEPFELGSSTSPPVTLPPVVICGPPLAVIDGFRADQSGLRRDSVRDHFAGINAIAARIVDSWNTPTPIGTVCCEGHADDTGASDYNIRLGRRRADTVRTALINAVTRDSIRRRRPDIPARIHFAPITSGGEDFPIASNATEDGRLRNRRVDVSVGPAVLPSRRSPRARPRRRVDPGLGTCLTECQREFERCRRTGNLIECRRALKSCQRDCRGRPV